MSPQQFDFDNPVERRNRNSFKWDRFAPDVLPMWVADMDFRTAPAILDALHKTVDHGVFGYANTPAELNEVVVSRLQSRCGWAVDPDWFVWLPGVVAGLSACCRIAGEPGDAIMINPPIYHHFLSVPTQAHRELIKVPLRCQDNRWTMDLDAMRAQVTPRTRMLLLCSPHNPVGRVFTRDELEALGEFCAEHDLIVCSDEIHCELVLEPTIEHVPYVVANPDYRDNTITLIAPSKTFNLAGVNASLAIIPDPQLRARLIKETKSIVPMASTLAYTAALAAYRDSDDWHRALLDYLRGNRDLLAAAIDDIPELSMAPVEATYLGWIDTSQLHTDDAHALFVNYGVGLSAGREFDDPGFQRINFACTRANVIEALERIKNAVAGCR